MSLICPLVLCATKLRSRNELDNHNRAEHVGKGHFHKGSVEMPLCYKQNMSYHIQRVHKGMVFSCRGENEIELNIE